MGVVLETSSSANAIRLCRNRRRRENENIYVAPNLAPLQVVCENDHGWSQVADHRLLSACDPRPACTLYHANKIGGVRRGQPSPSPSRSSSSSTWPTTRDSQTLGTQRNW